VPREPLLDSIWYIFVLSRRCTLACACFCGARYFTRLKIKILPSATAGFFIVLGCMDFIETVSKNYPEKLRVPSHPSSGTFSLIIHNAVICINCRALRTTRSWPSSSTRGTVFRCEFVLWTRRNLEGTSSVEVLVPALFFAYLVVAIVSAGLSLIMFSDFIFCRTYSPSHLPHNLPLLSARFSSQSSLLGLIVLASLTPPLMFSKHRFYLR